MKINIFWGELTDNSAKKEALLQIPCPPHHVPHWNAVLCADSAAVSDVVVHESAAVNDLRLRGWTQWNYLWPHRRDRINESVYNPEHLWPV